MHTTTQLETVNVKVEKCADLAISSQAPEMVKVQRLAGNGVGLSSPKRGTNRKKPLAERFYSKVQDTDSGCQIWTGCLMPNGYGQFHLNGKTAYAHRVAYELHYGSIGELFVLHKCDNRRCVNPSHLFLGTFNDNMRDMTKKGRQAHGEKNGQAKLTIDQVLAIRAATGSQTDIAKPYQISDRTVGDIKRRRSWKTV
jgi:hypothetical protein